MRSDLLLFGVGWWLGLACAVSIAWRTGAPMTRDDEFIALGILWNAFGIPLGMAFALLGRALAWFARLVELWVRERREADAFTRWLNNGHERKR